LRKNFNARQPFLGGGGAFSTTNLRLLQRPDARGVNLVRRGRSVGITGLFSE
jgi:hypothetical protein